MNEYGQSTLANILQALEQYADKYLLRIHALLTHYLHDLIICIIQTQANDDNDARIWSVNMWPAFKFHKWRSKPLHMKYSPTYGDISIWLGYEKLLEVPITVDKYKLYYAMHN